MRPMPPEVDIAIEYDCRGKRKRKNFSCMYEGRRFYVSKFKANKNPKVINNQKTEKVQ